MTKLNTTNNGAEAFSAFPSMVPFSTPSFEGFARTGETWSKAYVAWQEEVARLTAARFQRDSQAGQALIACKTWEDFVRLQQDWAMSTVRACIEDATRVTQFVAKFAPNLVSGAERHDPSPIASGTHPRAV